MVAEVAADVVLIAAVCCMFSWESDWVVLLLLLLLLWSEEKGEEARVERPKKGEMGLAESDRLSTERGGIR